jgi:outer membrane immunogenic protein
MIVGILESQGVGMGARTATAIFVAMCTTQVAIAADVLGPPPTFYDWTGVYIGANAGYASANTSGSSTTSTQSISGAIAGGQIGANLQYRNTVFGVEADADWSGQQSSGTDPVIKIPWLATARVRLGYAYDRIAYFATAGAGYMHFTSTSPSSGAASTSTRTAWVAGVAQESAINSNLILRFEVLYLQLLGNADTPAGVTSVPSSQRVYDIIGRVGLSYKFGWPGN